MVGLKTNTSKMQTMICTPGRTRTQLLTDSYQQLQWGNVTAAEWNARDVECSKCGKTMKGSSLRHHLADMHNVHQQTVVAEEMLVSRLAKSYGNLLQQFDQEGSGRDELGLGRWTYMRFAGEDRIVTRVICGYSPCANEGLRHSISAASTTPDKQIERRHLSSRAFSGGPPASDEAMAEGW